ncbi:MAG: 2-dehydro-3-deoxyphosphogluconate aldolase [Flavobacteriaceae bacterium]|nr:2-dehydro-3-deoxyphosphogluconate aldolase [Flavobacteriaceae bacterium]|tara:strand:+ start:34715 stop:35338 length:624 start_codon:yes stop_codon:yes gene_type:complete
MSILNKIINNKVIAVIRSTTSDDLSPFIDVIVESGINSIEITLTTPNALSIIKQLRRNYKSSILLGAGTVTDLDSAKKSLDAGAEFIVSPIYNIEVINYLKKNRFPIISGAFSPTEIYNSYHAGVDMIKIFPANLLGLENFKSIQGIMPNLLLMPTGGLTSKNARNWLDAGADVLGIGSSLINDQIVSNKDFDTLKLNSQKILESIK